MADEGLGIRLGGVVGHHALAGHDLAVEVVDLGVQSGHAGVVPLVLGNFVIQVHAGQIELADHVLQGLVFIVGLAGRGQGQITLVGLKSGSGFLEKVDHVHGSSPF